MRDSRRERRIHKPQQSHKLSGGEILEAQMPFFVYLGLATPAPGYAPFWFDCPWPVGDNEVRYRNAEHMREINLYLENIGGLLDGTARK